MIAVGCVLTACQPIADLVERHAEIHVVGRVVDGTDAGVANTVMRVTAHTTCETALCTAAQAATQQDGTFAVVLSTMVGTTVCLKVQAEPPEARSELRPDSVADVPAVFPYEPPYDTVRIDLKLGALTPSIP